MRNDITDLTDLTESLERACSIQVLDVDLFPPVCGITHKLALVKFYDDSRKVGVHLIEIGPGNIIDVQIPRHELIHQTRLSPVIPQLVTQSKDLSEKTVLLVYELKGCPVYGVRTLKSYLRAEQPDLTCVGSVLRGLSDALYEWNRDKALESSSWSRDTAWELLRRSLEEVVPEELRNANWLNGVQSRISTIIENDAVHADALLFDDCYVIMPNPLAYLALAWPDLWPSDLVLVWPTGHQLGKLSCDSLVVTGDSDHPFYLVNFTSYKQGLLFLDGFHLEIDVLLNYMRLHTHLGWKEFITLTRELTGNLELSSDVQLPGDRSSLAWHLLSPLRANLLKLVGQMSESGIPQEDFELAAWLSAVVAGIQIAVESTSRPAVERKAALFYAASALTRLLPQSPKNEPIVSARQSAQVRRTTRLPRSISAFEFEQYIQWITEEGGATKRIIAGLDEWFVDPETQLARVVGVRHYDEEWLIDLEEQWGSGFHPDKRKHLGGADELKSFIEERHRVVLLGEPGSGKTTLLEYLFLDYAKAIYDPDADIPVLVRLGSFRGEQSFEDFLMEQLGNLAAYFEPIKGRLVLLCDALNEMPYTSYGPDKRSLIDEVQTYLENTTITWILSCRVRDYVSHNLSQVGRGVTRVEIMPLDIPRVQQIIQHRFRKIPLLAIGLWEELSGGERYASVIPGVWKKFDQHGEAARFWDWRGIDALQSLTAAPQYITEREQGAWKAMHERRLMRLCRNPYMLKLIAHVYVDSLSEGRPMPDIQGQIIHQVATNLISNELSRRKSMGEDLPEQLNTTVMEALQIVAFAMQAHHETLQTETEIRRKDAITALEKENLDQAERLIELASSAQILGGDEEKIRFSHQLMQEYFAGMTLVRSVRDTSPVVYWPQERWWEPSRLDETAVIVVGWYQEWPSVVEWIAQANPELAAECLTRNLRSSEDLDSETGDFIHSAIQQKIEGAQSLHERAAAFRALGWFGDTRSGVGVRPDGILDIQWSDPIPPGSFQMGGDPEALKSWKGMTHSINYTYYMAKYPITVSQYRCFIDDGGYTEKWRQCWSNDGWQWRLRMRKSYPYAWKDPRWVVPNHPVIGVTWYEAYAFTGWLHFKLLEAGLLPDDNLVVRLPIEAEWEKAARGVEGLKFPWGMQFEPGYANVREGDHIGCTSAVGLFGEKPASPYGVEDLSGNVWEWCLSEWRETYEPDEPVRLEGEAARSSRGGSWYHSANHARSASRFWYRPGVADFGWGFRVCASVDIPSALSCFCPGHNERVND